MSAGELRKDIERTREDLGATVEGLAAKADVKARALRAVDGGKQAVAGAPGKAARTAKSAVGAVGPRRLVAGAVSAVVTACAVRAVARGAAARRTRTRGPRRRPPGA